MPYTLFIVGCLYASEVVGIWLPAYATPVFFLSMLFRFIRVIKLWNFFRMKEMDMHVNMRRIALLKFFMMVFGLSHWAGRRGHTPCCSPRHPSRV